MDLRYVSAFIICMFAISAVPSIIGGIGTVDLDDTGAAGDELFIDVTSERFDDTSKPNFISAGDWNGDGYEDILVNGHRLYRNSGHPYFNLSLQTSVFQSSVSGSANGVWADFDDDGDLDLYQGCGKNTADRLWENQGYPGFEMIDVSDQFFGSWENLGPNTGNSWSDFDGDGDLDIYVGSGEDWNDGNPIYYQDHLLRNDGGSGFTDVTSSAGMSGENMYARGATWGDFNNDRMSDLYVSHYRIRENHLFVNQGDGSFLQEGEIRNCSGTLDETWYRDTTAGQVYGQSMWGPTYGHTIGSSWADFNRDGNLDLWTSDFVHKYVGYIGSWYDIRGYVCDDGNLYINDGAPQYTFTDYRNSSGIPIWPVGGQGTYRGDQTFSGITIGDFDNDGWEDIYIPQVYGDLSYTTPHLFHNRGSNADPEIPNGTVFEDVTDIHGIKGSNTYANLFLDYDLDGDLDLFTGGGDTWDSSAGKWTGYRLRLFENQGAGGNKWLKVDLNGPAGNPDGIGTRVSIPVPVSASQNHLMTREVRAGTGHAHQSSSLLHFGFGTDVSPEDYDPYRMTVYWPDGGIQYVDIETLNSTIVVDYPTDDFPVIDQVWVQPFPLAEDNLTRVSVDADAGSGSISRYLWDLDSDNHFDEATSENYVEFMVYRSGLRYVRCLVENSNGLGMEALHIPVDPDNLPPVITSFPGQIVGNVDDFADLSSIEVFDSPSDLRNITWNVSWGDGTYMDGIGPPVGTHVYTFPIESIFSISLTDGDLWNNYSQSIRILNVPPWGYLEPAGGNRTTYDEDEKVPFDVHIFDTPSDSTGHMVQWSFDDGITYGPWEDSTSTMRSFPTTGIHNISARIKDQYHGITQLNGSVIIVNPQPELDVRYSTGLVRADEDSELDLDGWVDGADNPSDLQDLRYRWDFGDGNVTDWYASPDIYHTYERQGSYEAVCTVIDDDGDTGNATFDIEVSNILPLIDPLELIPEVFEDQFFTITAGASDTLSDENDLYFTFDLGDGRTIDGSEQVEISYPGSGSYTITVSVFDDDGDSDSASTTVNVLNRPPRGSIAMDITTSSVLEDHPVTFTAVDLADESHDLPNLTVTWGFGDGSDEVQGTEVSHIYTRKGSFKVRMSISDGNDETVKTRTVIVDNLPPLADFSVFSQIVDVGVAVLFDAGTSQDTPSDLPFLIYTWEYGDGSGGTGVIDNHTYDIPGNYTVKLSVFDNDGAVSYAELVITVTGDGGSTPGDSDDISIGMVIALSVLIILILIVILIVGIIVINRIRTGSVSDKTEVRGQALLSQTGAGLEPGGGTAGLIPPSGRINSPPPPLPPHPIDRDP